MNQCPPLTREMLRDPVDLTLAPAGLDFSRAKAAADRHARELSPEPMLLAWFERSSGRYSPNVPCCQEDRPPWLVYAASRGGDLIIAINDLDYVFVYRRT